MSSGFDPNIILKSRVGQLRLATVGVGLFTLAFFAAGHDYLYLNDFHQPTCGSSVEFGRCPAIWADKLGLAMIIIAWLFSIAMLICATLPSLSQNPPVRMADGFGHIGAGVLAFLGGLLGIWWVMTIYWGWAACDLEDTDAFKKYCTKKVFLTVDKEDRLTAIKESNGQSRKGGPQSRKGPAGGYYNTINNEDASVGFKGWLWVAAAVFATVFLVLCILIFLQLKKAGPRGPMMMGGMMTQQPSQAPMSMHPSQMTQQQQQQQNPDQQSVHPSQMTQQQA